MGDGKITYRDVEEYETLFTLAPSFLLELLARKNKNLVSKYKPIIQGYMNNLTHEQRNKLDIILSSDVDELQGIMDEAYRRSGKRQYQILANPNYKKFIVDNLDGLREMI